MDVPRILMQESLNNHHPTAELPWASERAAARDVVALPELAFSRVLTQNDHKMLMNEIKIARLLQQLAWF